MTEGRLALMQGLCVLTYITPLGIILVEGNMRTHRLLVLLGGIFLMVGAAPPWGTARSVGLGTTLSASGNEGEGDGILTAAGGAILFMMALVAKGSPGKVYSILAAIISLLCGLLLIVKVIELSVLDSTTISVSFGLICASLGALLGLVGSFSQVPQDRVATGPAA